MSPDNGNTFGMASASSARNEEQLALSIVIPVYHSADCLQALNAAISEALGPLGILYEVIWRQQREVVAGRSDSGRVVGGRYQLVR